ncbi:hypothetical protein ACLOJK_032890 [Asimina triloba]
MRNRRNAVDLAAELQEMINAAAGGEMLEAGEIRGESGRKGRCETKMSRLEREMRNNDVRRERERTNDIEEDNRWRGRGGRCCDDVEEGNSNVVATAAAEEGRGVGNDGDMKRGGIKEDQRMRVMISGGRGRGRMKPRRATDGEGGVDDVATTLRRATTVAEEGRGREDEAEGEGGEERERRLMDGDQRGEREGGQGRRRERGGEGEEADGRRSERGEGGRTR